MAEIHHALDIAAPAERVLALASTAGGLAEWWAEDVESVAEGVVSLGFFNRTTIYRLQLLDREARRVAWRCETGNEWEGTDLIFTLTPRKSAVGLDFVHANWPAATPYFVSCNTTWGGLMFRLRAAAEGRRPGPLFLRAAFGY